MLIALFLHEMPNPLYAHARARLDKMGDLTDPSYGPQQPLPNPYAQHNLVQNGPPERPKKKWQIQPAGYHWQAHFFHLRPLSGSRVSRTHNPIPQTIKQYSAPCPASQSPQTSVHWNATPRLTLYAFLALWLCFLFLFFKIWWMGKGKWLWPGAGTTQNHQHGELGRI